MIGATEFLDALAAIGCHHLAGVPCSYLGPVYDRLAVDPRFTYLPATSEGAAFAMVVGMQLAGTEAALLVQNSGFGNLVNPLTSLAMPYRVPVLTVMTMRGWPHADAGEPQHEVMGRTAMPLLDRLGLPYVLLPDSTAGVADALARVQEHRRTGTPTFVLVPERLRADASAGPATDDDRPLSRGAAIAELGRILPDAVFVSTTGYISRDLFGQLDRPENLYLQGAMGHALSVAAGVALRRPDRRVVALDGDGSALMHLGAMSTVGGLDLPNLVHVVLDNGRYESTGGQVTSAASTDFPGVATACGYRRAISVDDVPQLRAAERTLRGRGPVLAHLRITARSPATGARASGTIRVDQLARRFAATLGGGGHADDAAGVPGHPVGLGPVGGR